MQYGFYFDAEQCIGCNACVMACQDWNDLLSAASDKPENTKGATANRELRTENALETGERKPGTKGVYWRRVTTVESGKYPNVRLTNQSLSCLHCGQPACAAECPAKAISKRAQDGIVIVDYAKCQGCRTCLQACPWGIPQYGHDGKMQICNFCADKVSQGEAPACAAACTGGALFAGPLDELGRIFLSHSPARLAGNTEPSLLIPKTSR